MLWPQPLWQALVGGRCRAYFNGGATELGQSTCLMNAFRKRMTHYPIFRWPRANKKLGLT
jgi:hypothetical protein